jgi:hypothetical protein
MSRVARSAAPAAEPSYLVWKAAAVKACQKIHEHAARVTRESIWTRAYVLRLSPVEAAEVAAREYDATHPAAWVKRRR